MTESIVWLTSGQVAERTGKHPVTVRLALETGELHGHQRTFRGRWKVNEAAMDAWIQGVDGTRACGCAQLRLVKKAA